MADGFTISFEDEQVERLIIRLLRKVKSPKKLMDQVKRYVHAVTMQMYRGERPDTKAKRGQTWAKLKPETIRQKAALKRRGKAIEIHRPLVRTGKARDSLKVLQDNPKGFIYGTKIRSNKGFPYMGVHQKGDSKNPQRKSIFLNRHDLRQVVKMTIDYLKDKEFGFKKYVKK